MHINSIIKHIFIRGDFFKEKNKNEKTTQEKGDLCGFNIWKYNVSYENFKKKLHFNKYL